MILIATQTTEVSCKLREIINATAVHKFINDIKFHRLKAGKEGKIYNSFFVECLFFSEIGTLHSINSMLSLFQSYLFLSK